MHRGPKRMLREEGLGPGEHSSVLHLWRPAAAPAGQGPLALESL